MDLARHLPRVRRPSLIVEGVGLHPLGPSFSFLQFCKILPLLVGQQYKVRLKITNQGGYDPRHVRFSLEMWVKEHGRHKLKRQALLRHPEIPTNQPSYDVESKPYLMRDTGASDLKIQAYVDRQPLTLQYKKWTGQALVYAYHVEPWRSSLLVVLISIAAFIAAIVTWALTWIGRL